MTTALQAARLARGWSQARAVWELMRFADSKGMKVATAVSLKTQLSRWENGHVTPEYYQQLLCDFYNMPPGALGITDRHEAPGPVAENGELITDPEWLRTLDQLDQEAGWEPGTARRQVAAQLAQLDPSDVHDASAVGIASASAASPTRSACSTRAAATPPAAVSMARTSAMTRRF